MRTLIALLSALALVATSACSRDDKDAHPYAVQTAAIGASLAVLGPPRPVLWIVSGAPAAATPG